MSSAQLKQYNLTDTIVEIRFKSTLFQATIGYFHKALLEFAEKNVDLKFISAIQILNPVPSATSPNIVDQTKYEDKDIKISITPSTINFNSVSSYIGWEAYFSKIKALMTVLHNSGAIVSYSRIGVRYITEFKQQSVFSELNGTFNLQGINNPGLTNSQIKTGFQDGGFQVNVNLTNEFTRSNEENQSEKISLIDVDTQYRCQTNSLEELFPLIDATKAKQKETFYKLVTK